MSLLEIDPETKTSVLVHSYAVAGGDLKDHIKYMNYITNSFDLEMIIIDNAGYQFIDGCNESKLFLDKQINFFEFNSGADGDDYLKELKNAKRQYNKTAGTICFKQVFSSDWIRKANEHLQASIDHKKIWFSSRATANEKAFNKQSSYRVNLEDVACPTLLDLIEQQDNHVYQTKRQCALVEVKTTPRGTQTFDLPQHLKRSTSASRARKDNYTTLMLACWATKCYFDMTSVQESSYKTFSPIMIR
jgi:hypothetical protein